MKKWVAWTGIATLTFAAGVSCVALYLLDRRPAARSLDDPPCFYPPHYDVTGVPCSGADLSGLAGSKTVSYCELIASPGEYEGKFVRIRTRAAFGLHGTAFFDPRCDEPPDVQVAIVTGPLVRGGMFQAIEDAHGKGNPLGPIELTAVGTFKRNNPTRASDLRKDNAQYKFEVVLIEEAAKSEWAR